MFVGSRTTEYRSGGVRHPTLPCTCTWHAPTRHVWGQGKAAGFLVADGFATNPQMARRFPPPWPVAYTCAMRCAEGRQRDAELLEPAPMCVITPGGQSKLTTTVWASKDANFAVATSHWYYRH